MRPGFFSSPSRMIHAAYRSGQGILLIGTLIELSNPLSDETSFNLALRLIVHLSESLLPNTANNFFAGVHGVGLLANTCSTDTLDVSNEALMAMMLQLTAMSKRLGFFTALLEDTNEATATTPRSH